MNAESTTLHPPPPATNQMDGGGVSRWMGRSQSLDLFGSRRAMQASSWFIKFEYSSLRFLFPFPPLVCSLSLGKQEVVMVVVILYSLKRRRRRRRRRRGWGWLRARPCPAACCCHTVNAHLQACCLVGALLVVGRVEPFLGLNPRQEALFASGPGHPRRPAPRGGQCFHLPSQGQLRT